MFVERNQNGEIAGAFARPQYVGQEEIDNTDDELLLFLNPPKSDEQIREEQIVAKLREIAIAALDGS